MPLSAKFKGKKTFQNTTVKDKKQIREEKRKTKEGNSANSFQSSKMASFKLYLNCLLTFALTYVCLHFSQVMKMAVWQKEYLP